MINMKLFSVYLLVVLSFDSLLMSSVAFNLPSCSYRGSHITSLYSSSVISSLLNTNDDDPYSKYTHQIAIPLGDASELHSALHAIQTSLVRDCPRLIRACVMPALLRLPLLYVDGSSLGLNLGGGQSVETILESVVHRSIMEVIYGEDTQSSNEAPSSSSTSLSNAPLVEMAQPILLPFRGLELQGDDNSVLYAVGHNINDENGKKKHSRYDEEDDYDGVTIVEDWSTSSPTPSGWEKLEALVYKIQGILESEYDCKTCWPSDEAQGEELDYNGPLQKKWRPRVPFVRLPTDFYQELQKDLDQKENRGFSADIEGLSSVDLGLDGISPLFWYEAWGEDDILPAPGVRMRSVSIYRRMVPGGGEAESSFYVPASDARQSLKRGVDDAKGSKHDNKSMDLPIGDMKTMARERRERAKAMERMGDEERRAEREWEEGKAQWTNDLDDERESKELTEVNVGMEIGDVTVEGDAAYTSPWAERSISNDDSDESGNRMEAVPLVETVAEITLSETKVQTSKHRKELPSIEDNPIFQRLWEGKSQVTAQGQTSVQPLDPYASDEESLPPYPSDPHFTGLWRIVSSPFGSSSSEGDGLSSSSDNFIFRVDGQVMGGPILNSEYQHKAAGGSWKFFNAVMKSNSDESSKSPITQTRLRVRLLVPPEKSQTLVIEGEINRLISPNADDTTLASTSDSWRTASGGILEGMSRKLKQDTDSADYVKTFRGDKGNDAMIFCRGEAWLEDTEDGLNRKKLGAIALMKLKTPDRNKLIYTVPASKGLPGDDGDDD